MNNNKPFVSIIVLNYNGKKWLKECFESLEKLDYPKDRCEIILCDNASNDDSVEYTKENFRWVKVLQLDKNYGFCKANNLCAKCAIGEYLAFLNNDTVVEKEWLKELVKGVISEENVISCACKMFMSEVNIIQCVGGVITLDGCGFYDGYMEVDSEKYNKQKYTGFGGGSGFIIQKNFFISTGGFDEYYFFTGEENDLGFRVWAYGFKVLYAPSAVMYHYTGGTTATRERIIPPTLESIVTRNKLYFIIKNFEVNNVVKGIILHLFRSFAIVVYAILHKNIYVIIAIIKAYLFVIKDIKKILKNRKIFQKNKIVKDSELYKRGIVVGIRRWLKINIDALRNREKKISRKGDIFDTKDLVKIKTNNKGELTFYKS